MQPLPPDVELAEPAPEEPQPPLGGLWSTLMEMFATLTDITYTRFELLFLDMQEASEQLVSMLLWSLIGLFAVFMTLLIGALALIFIFWETHRVLVAVVVTAAFATLALIALGVVLSMRRSRQPPFAATLEEIAKDRQHFKIRS